MKFCLAFFSLLCAHRAHQTCADVPLDCDQGEFLHSTAHEILKRSEIPREREFLQYEACSTLTDM